VIGGFEFEDGGRKFTCTVEESKITQGESWWWFSVSTGDKHRYAPFRTTNGDTRESVRIRIVGYYDNLLARRAEPAPNYWRRGAPKKDVAQG
jgi:hypothetical protein